MRKKFLSLLALCVFFNSSGLAQDLALKGGTFLTMTKGRLENGTMVIQKGKITAVGKDIAIPAGMKVIDVSGKFIMPGIIDTHMHIAMPDSDINEMTDPVTPQIWMKEAINPGSDSIAKSLAFGLTTIKTMHGSANVIGGVNVTMKLKAGATLEEMIIPGVRQQLKLALGENPKRVYGQEKGRLPMTRMGNAYVMRKAFLEARDYKAKWDEYEKSKAAGKENATPPKKDLGMETLKMVLEKKLSADCHVYRAEEIVWVINFCKEFGIDLKQLSHCLDGYKVADVIAGAGVSYGGPVDWWGGKEEAYDGNPFGFKIMNDAGVNIVINSDSLTIGRPMNLEAAKVLKYNDLSEEAVLKMITLNAAKSLELDGRLGSLEVGKDGDIAVFDRHPLDSTSKCVLTIIEGKIYFDYAQDSLAAKGAIHE